MQIDIIINYLIAHLMILNVNIFNTIMMLKILNERNYVLIIIINNNHLKRLIETNLTQKTF